MSDKQHNLGKLVTNLTTRIEVDETEITWDVEQFSRIVGITESWIFQGGPKSKHYWKLGINSICDSRGKFKLSIGLKLVAFEENFDTTKCLPEVRARFAISTVDPNEKTIKEREDACVLQRGGWHWLKSWNLHHFYDNDTLRVRCYLSIDLGPYQTSDISPTLDGPATDIVIMSQLKCFLAHRKVLLSNIGATSPFFRNLLDPKAKRDVIEIPYRGDLTALRVVLGYLYTGELTEHDLESYRSEINELIRLFGLPELKVIKTLKISELSTFDKNLNEE